MEKTIQIVLAGTQFALEEGAYERLHAYLESLKAHFAGQDGSKEIINDIELRLVEKLLEKKHAVVTMADVESVVQEMGEASQMGDAEAAEPGQASGNIRKLYRDQDNAIIGGVAAGVSAYFNIDPIFIRVLLVISAFFGGSGIFVYLLLWLLLPEARTASQKLEMRGSVVTLESIKEVVHARANEVRTHGGIKKLIYFPFIVLGTIVRFTLKHIVPFAGKAFGVVLAVGAFAGAIALTIGLGTIVFNQAILSSELPVYEVVSTGLLWTMFISAYLVLLIPLVLVCLLGVRLLRSKSVVPSSVGFGLIGIWALCIVVAGVAGARIGGNYYSYTSTSPAYQEATEVRTLEAFTSITASDKYITVRSGDTYSVELRGLQMDMAHIAVEVKDGVLSITPQFEERDCMFCRRVSPNVTVTVPNLQSVELRDSSARFDSYKGGPLSLVLRQSSIYGRLAVPSLVLDAQDSYMNLDGEADTLALTLSDSRYAGKNFLVQTSTISMDDSYATLNSAQAPSILKSIDSELVDHIGTSLLPQEQ